MDYGIPVGYKMWLIPIVLSIVFFVIGLVSAQLLKKAGIHKHIQTYPPKGKVNLVSGSTSSVLIELNNTWQPGFLIERSITGVCIVFVPGAPVTSNGAVYVVPTIRVIPLNMPNDDLDTSIQRLGKGMSGYVSDLFDVG
jgi:hypothetical protein